MKKTAFALLTILALAACATNSVDDQISALNIAPEDMAGMYSIEVPSATAGNFISQGVMLAMSKMGSTPTSKMIEDVLHKNVNARLAIIGDSQTNNVLNLQQALKDFQGQSNAIIYIKATPEQFEKLQQIATPKGITIKNGSR
ncbi:MAG: hypothetical protein J6U05_06110 [Neisseriaceae bacterium]|nr:hypothetical protein [Neisseriaceae bacterium]MBO7555115.1 hypothetical protein [Neisseriaceae bacterium]